MARGYRKSLVGMKFGKLEVVSYNGVDSFRNSMWNCICDCGNKTIEKGTLLTNGKIISCGICSERLAKNPIPISEEEQADKSIIGQRFGKLVVKDIFYKKNKNGKAIRYAQCICDCGNEKAVATNSLLRGQTLSCGCLKKEKVRNTLYKLSDDFIGTRFGKLVVENYNKEKRKWQCKCDCGNTIYLMKRDLTNAGYRSCGNCFGRKTKNRRTREELKNDK